MESDKLQPPRAGRKRFWLASLGGVGGGMVYAAREALRRLDTHVVIGDRHFDVERGEYDLREIAPGKTELSLSTTYRISTRVNGYGNFWAHRTLDDFHTVVLGLIKRRAELALPR